MPEIAEAQALLVALAETGDVKAARAQERRRMQLHVAYGNALIAARGCGAPETTEAFARARESARNQEDAAESLAADYGVWVGSYLRGELPAMRAHAATFLKDVEAKPDSPEAGVAHRAWSAPSRCLSLVGTTTSPSASAMIRASARCSTWRSPFGRWANSPARSPSSRAQGRGSPA